VSKVFLSFGFCGKTVGFGVSLFGVEVCWEIITVMEKMLLSYGLSSVNRHQFVNKAASGSRQKFSCVMTRVFRDGVFPSRLVL
jgi:hypothetical protein